MIRERNKTMYIPDNLYDYIHDNTAVINCPKCNETYKIDIDLIDDGELFPCKCGYEIPKERK